MPSLPISGLPAGIPSDENLLAQSTGVGGQTQEVSELQLFEYISSKSINNVLYVSDENGIDAVGRGTELSPYSTISYAISQISNHSLITLIKAFGDFNETTLTLSRNLIIDLQDGGLTVANPVTLDTSWTGNTGILYLVNSSNLNLVGGLTPDFSAATFAVFKLYNLITSSSAAWTIDGNPVGGTIFISNGVFGFAGAPSLTVNDCYGGINSCAYSGITIVDNGTGSDFNLTCEINTILGDFIVKSTNTRNMNVNSSLNVVVGNTLIQTTSTGQANVQQTSINNFGTYTIDGTNSFLNTDAMSIVPSLTGGALSSQITYRNISDTITAGFSPISYTPTDPQVKGHLEGIDDELNIGTGRVAFGVAGGGILGDSTFTFDISTKKLTVNSISSLFANIDSYGIGYHDINDGLSLVLTNPMFTFINVTNAGSGLSISLPDMTDTRAIRADESPIFYIFNNGLQNVDIINNSSSLIVQIQPFQYYMFVVTDNSTSDGSFYFKNITNFVLTTADVDTGGENATGMNLIGGNQLSLTSATATFPGVVNTGSQTFSGDKSFNGNIDALNLLGTNTGNVTLNPVGVNSNNTGAQLIGQILELEPATASFPGVLTAADWNTFNNKQDGDVLGSGYLALTVAAGIINLSNPLANRIIMTGLGTGSVRFPAMNASDSMTSGRNTFCVITNNCTAPNDIANNSGTLIVQIPAGETYEFFVEDNSTSDGVFDYINLSHSSPITNTEIAYGNAGSTDITSSPNFTFDGDNLRSLSPTGISIFNPMTTTQRSAIASPPLGSQIFDTVYGTPMWYNGFNWAPQFVTNIFVPAFTILNAGLSSVTNNLCFYILEGNRMTIHASFDINVSATPFAGTVTTPIFSFTVPQQISSTFTGPGTDFSLGTATPIFNIGLNLGPIGTLHFRTATLPSFNILVYISGQNNAVLLPTNNSFSARLELSYFADVVI